MRLIALLIAIAFIYSISTADVQGQNKDKDSTDSIPSIRIEPDSVTEENYPNPF